MNSRSFLFPLAFSFSILAASAAAPQSNPPMAHAVGSVVRSGETLLARGFTMMEVLRHIGTPADKLSTNVWVYHNFNAGEAQERHDDCDTLLVTFTDGRVSNIQLVNRRAENVYAAQIRAKANDKVQIATK